ncbi:putative toxin-antitoxin system toxin component, PIN family [Candidatus Woesearchaeota archaeon]|nr:putative toxin-antitoxin system toxin component, PIN family [Candidatus Woesearchaeota archaeon]
MKLVIDTNRIIAALITNSASRKIIKNIDYQFIAPDYSLEEIRKYKDEICKKSELDEEEFAVLLDLIFNNIKIISKLDYIDFIAEAEELIKIRDIKDAPFLALAIAEKADEIWSEDKDFLVQNRIKIYTTEDLLISF